jgi:hypothetical protein
MHLQHVLTAAAMNLIRIGVWLGDTSLAKTRRSVLTTLMPLPIGASPIRPRYQCKPIAHVAANCMGFRPLTA